MKPSLRAKLKLEKAWQTTWWGALPDIWLGKRAYIAGRIGDMGAEEAYYIRAEPFYRKWLKFRPPYSLTFERMGGPRSGVRTYGVACFLCRRGDRAKGQNGSRLIWSTAIWTRLLHPCPMVGDRILNYYAGRPRCLSR